MRGEDGGGGGEWGTVGGGRGQRHGGDLRGHPLDGREGGREGGSDGGREGVREGGSE